MPEFPSHRIESDKPGTECGITALYLHPSLASKSITEQILKIQLQNNHRGEESAGVCVSDGSSVSIPLKEMGLVKNLYKIYQKTRSKDFGHMGIGHNRYSTTGTSNLENAAPYRHIDP